MTQHQFNINFWHLSWLSGLLFEICRLHWIAASVRHALSFNASGRHEILEVLNFLITFINTSFARNCSFCVLFVVVSASRVTIATQGRCDIFMLFWVFNGLIQIIMIVYHLGSICLDVVDFMKFLIKQSIDIFSKFLWSPKFILFIICSIQHFNYTFCSTEASL